MMRAACRNAVQSGGKCPACPLLGKPYREQLQLKELRVKSILARAGIAHAPRVGPVVPSPAVTGYRMRAALPMREAKSQAVVDIRLECVVLHPVLAAVVAALPSADHVTDLVVDPETLAVKPKTAFVQANPAVAKLIDEMLLTRVPAGARCLELHAGSGRLSTQLHAKAVHVTAVELKPGVPVESFPFPFFESDADEFCNNTRDAFDVIIVNPPRPGLSVALRDSLPASATLLLYVSCYPPTLGRDVAHLERSGGWRCETVTPFDMMPQTEHVEVVAVLRRQPGAAASAAAAAAAASAAEPILTAAPPGASDVLCMLARGVMHPRGSIAQRRYERVRVVGGHSLIRIVEVKGRPIKSFAKALAAIGHPLVGDWSDMQTARHFEKRHMLDGPFVYVGDVMPPQLEIVLESLERKND